MVRTCESGCSSEMGLKLRKHPDLGAEAAIARRYQFHQPAFTVNVCPDGCFPTDVSLIFLRAATAARACSCPCWSRRSSYMPFYCCCCAQPSDAGCGLLPRMRLGRGDLRMCRAHTYFVQIWPAHHLSLGAPQSRICHYWRLGKLIRSLDGELT